MSLSFKHLRQANENRQIEWEAGSEFSLTYLGNALAGETGEACNVIKKLDRERSNHVGSRATIDDLADELADVIIYADLIAKKEQIDLGEAIRNKFNKTSEKYGLGVRIIARR